MIYYYEVIVSYRSMDIEYKKRYILSFSEIGPFIANLEKEYRDLYTIVSIKEKRND